MSATATTIELLTAEEFTRLYENDHVELDAGRVVRLPMPMKEHGFVASNLVAAFHPFVKAHNLGRVISHDAWVVVKRDPDYVKGPDVAFYSYERLPTGPVPRTLDYAIPELAVEVESPSDRWPKILQKVNLYLGAGVKIVLVVSPEDFAISVFRKDELMQVLDNGDELTLPDLLPGFSLKVRSIFE